MKLILACKALLQSTTRAPLGEPQDKAMVENVWVALQMSTEPVGVPYSLPGVRAGLVYLWETTRLSSDCRYRARASAILRYYGSIDLPRLDVLRNRWKQNAGMPDRKVLGMMETQNIPYPHRFTARCGNAALHSELLERYLSTVIEHEGDPRRQRHVAHRDDGSVTGWRRKVRETTGLPRGRRSNEVHLNSYPSDEVHDQAVKLAGEEWRRMLQQGVVQPCSLHTASAQQFQQALDITEKWIAGDASTVEAVTPNSTDPAIDLAWSLLHQPISVSRGNGELLDGQSRLCQARLLGIASLPVALLD